MRTLLLAFLWWVLTEGAGGGWLLAALIIAAAVWTTFVAPPWSPRRLHFGGVIRFIPFFLAQSIAGGIDVARRAFHPALPLQRGMINYPVALPSGTARLFFTGMVSLLPGTLSVELLEESRSGAGNGLLRIHLLDTGAPIQRKLRSLERRVAHLYGIPWSEDGD